MMYELFVITILIAIILTLFFIFETLSMALLIGVCIACFFIGIWVFPFIVLGIIILWLCTNVSIEFIKLDGECDHCDKKKDR